MAKIVTHKQINITVIFGGQMNTTLCGRVSDALADGMNVGDIVTCKLCQRIINNRNHYRHKQIANSRLN